VSEPAPIVDVAPNGAPSERFLRWRRPLPWALFAVVVLVVLILAATAWIGTRALLAKASLEKAQTLIGELESSAVEDPTSASELAERISRETSSARRMTSDLIWRGGEVVPLLGVNLTVVRELAATVDDVAQNAIEPLADVAAELDPSALKPVDGRIDLAPLAGAAGSAARADDTVMEARERVLALSAEGTLGAVEDARAQLAGLLDDAASLTSLARTLTELAPPMLGSDGPRNYVLMFQNNAEARALGGNPAVLVLVKVVDGTISLERQASSLDFPRGGEPPLALDPAIFTVYPESFPRYVMDITTRPDFPTAAVLAKAYWEQEFGDVIDGVMSFDPVALGYLLDATGPVPLATGDQLTGDNAVRVLLSDVYAQYEDPLMQDAFFASAASSIFEALTEGQFAPGGAIDALSRGVDEHRLLLWSANADEQALIAATPLSGILPSTNDEETVVGVYYMDQSSSKIDYYLDTAVSVTSDQCVAATPTFVVSALLSSRLTQEQADVLPAYVVSGWWGRDRFATDVYLVGPVGSTFIDTDTPESVIATGSDQGRPVVRMSVLLHTGEEASVSARFQGAAGEYGPLTAYGTPMVNETLVSLESEGC